MVIPPVRDAPPQYRDPTDVVKAALDGELTQRESGLRAEVLAATDAKLAGVDALVAQRVSDTTPALRDQILATTRAELDARAQDVRAAAGADAGARVQAGSDQLHADLSAALDGLRG